MLAITGRIRRGGCFIALLTFFGAFHSLVRSAVAADKVTLKETATDSRVYVVDHRLNVNGKLRTAVGKGKTQELELQVDAFHNYRERRLPGNGRGPKALRSLREFTTAEAKISVEKRNSSSQLQSSRKKIVAFGRREGVVSYCPDGSLTASEIELLEMPGDSLAILALLPLKSVEVGDSWEPESWSMQILTGSEAVLKSEISCKLNRVANDTAYVSFIGRVEGATDGAASNINLTGTFQFDLKQNFIKQFDLVQKEKRSVGAASPGMDVQAEVSLKRSLSSTPGRLTDAAVAKIPLEPSTRLMWLTLETDWNVRLKYGRDWRLFHNTGNTAVLRLLEAGSLIAQCNLTRITSELPGKHTSEKQFQRDVRQALGDRLKSITKAEQMEVDDGRFLYRVTAVGESNGVEMTWYYYLCAAPSGEQATFVFAVETKLIKQLDNRDLQMVGSIEFLQKATRAAKRGD